jgi:hypothetical protein
MGMEPRRSSSCPAEDERWRVGAPQFECAELAAAPDAPCDGNDRARAMVCEPWTTHAEAGRSDEWTAVCNRVMCMSGGADPCVLHVT